MVSPEGKEVAWIGVWKGWKVGMEEDVERGMEEGKIEGMDGLEGL